MDVAPNGIVHAQSSLMQEQLVVAKIDLSQATRAMFLGEMETAAEMLFADTVKRDEVVSGA